MKRRWKGVAGTACLVMPVVECRTRYDMVGIANSSQTLVLERSTVPEDYRLRCGAVADLPPDPPEGQRPMYERAPWGGELPAGWWSKAAPDADVVLLGYVTRNRRERGQLVLPRSLAASVNQSLERVARGQMASLEATLEEQSLELRGVRGAQSSGLAHLDAEHGPARWPGMTAADEAEFRLARKRWAYEQSGSSVQAAMSGSGPLAREAAERGLPVANTLPQPPAGTKITSTYQRLLDAMGEPFRG